MTVQLTAWPESANCMWCESTKECITADFGDGFIRQAPLCWMCLQQALKVRHRQDAGKPETVRLAKT